MRVSARPVLDTHIDIDIVWASLSFSLQILEAAHRVRWTHDFWDPLFEINYGRESIDLGCVLDEAVFGHDSSSKPLSCVHFMLTNMLHITSVLSPFSVGQHADQARCTSTLTTSTKAIRTIGKQVLLHILYLIGDDKGRKLASYGSRRSRIG